jgi:hypothetical protein
MFVTFFYALNRKGWPKKWTRSTSDYYERFEKLLIDLKDKSIVVYTDDEKIQSISKKYSHSYSIFKSLQTFQTWNQLEFIKQGLSKKWFTFNVPEFFSEEYIALQLCKFEALYISSFLVSNPKEPLVWIDAGLRQQLTQSNFTCDWKKEAIHVTQFTALPFCERYITEVPGAFLMGGCFGGTGVLIRRLYKETTEILQELYSTNQCANDQQVLSILYWRKPFMFHVQKSYTQYIPFYASANWKNVLQILDSESKEFKKEYHGIILFILLILLLCIKLK